MYKGLLSSKYLDKSYFISLIGQMNLLLNISKTKTNNMAIYNTEIDPNIVMWEKLEQERTETMSDPKFREWVEQLHVSQSFEDRGGIIKANEMNIQYDFKKLK